MTKADLVNNIRNNGFQGMTKQGVESMIDKVFEALDCMPLGERLIVKGFGTFKRVTIKARECRNPRTGEKVVVPQHEELKFKASK